MNEPITKTERISRIAGKTSYKSFREGFGGNLAGDPDADIKMALGVAQKQSSTAAVKALETKYASTMLHEDFLCRAFMTHMATDVWVGKRKDEARDHHNLSKHRFACALAVRQFAGSRYIQSELPRYSWLLACRRQSLEEIIGYASRWLEDLSTPAETAFIHALREDDQEAA